MAKDTYLKKVLGNDHYQSVRNATVLMVGAGGIGCELLKNLILTGYGEIHIVDLDTITLSNLNRQFLFRKWDIDKSKSLTISTAVQRFNYVGTKLVPHHGNITDATQFPLPWWTQFDYVFNALDNLEARRYVNKMCLFLKKPLMESGTTGFDGQVQPIYPYYSECFDCQAKVTAKTFPVCTIRSTPSQPVHCITWAKEFLYYQLFDHVETSSSDTLSKETDDQQELKNLVQGVNELVELRTMACAGDFPKFFSELVRKIFKVDIDRLLLIDSLWKSRTKPRPLDMNDYQHDLNELIKNGENEKILFQDTAIWSTVQNLYVLYAAGKRLVERISGHDQFIPFDKDDDDTLNFVCAASNLRCWVFHIEVKSKFDIKEIAGNIIPAIATTNAIISGFSSLCGTKYFHHAHRQPSDDFAAIYRESSTIFISIKPNKYITSASLVPPNSKCASSSLVSRAILKLTPQDLHRNLQWLVDLLVEKYGYDGEAISLQLNPSRLIYDMDFDDNVASSLQSVGLKDGDILLVQDDDDIKENLEVYITVGGESTEISGGKLRPKKMMAQDTVRNGGENSTIVIDEDDDLVELEEVEAVEAAETVETAELAVAEPAVKRRKV
jgi:ubiquitin-like 1-activating enzyme E1 B